MREVPSYQLVGAPALEVRRKVIILEDVDDRVDHAQDYTVIGQDWTSKYSSFKQVAVGEVKVSGMSLKGVGAANIVTTPKRISILGPPPCTWTCQEPHPASHVLFRSSVSPAIVDCPYAWIPSGKDVTISFSCFVSQVQPLWRSYLLRGLSLLIKLQHITNVGRLQLCPFL